MKIMKLNSNQFLAYRMVKPDPQIELKWLNPISTRDSIYYSYDWLARVTIRAEVSCHPGLSFSMD